MCWGVAAEQTVCACSAAGFAGLVPQHFSWVFQPLIALGTVQCLQGAAPATALARTHRRPSLVTVRGAPPGIGATLWHLRQDLKLPWSKLPPALPALQLFFSILCLSFLLSSLTVWCCSDPWIMSHSVSLSASPPFHCTSATFSFNTIFS